MITRLIIIFVVFCTILSSYWMYAQSSIQPSPSGCTVYGRVWINSTPWVGAYVFVTDDDVQILLGEAVTFPASRGIDPGSYSIPSLPSKKKIKVFAFSDQAPGYYGYQEVTLPSGISKKEIIIDVSRSFSDPVFQ